MNNNTDLTNTEKTIISIFVALGLAAIYAVYAYIVMFIFVKLFGTANMMIAQFVPAFIICLIDIFGFDVSISDGKDNNNDR